MNDKPTPRGEAALPRRSLMPVVVPALVFLCTLTLVIWSAWPVWRPGQTIEVTQAMFVPTSMPVPDQGSGDGETLKPRTTRTVQAAGWLEAEPFYIAATALADGVIEEMLVLEGDHVQAGQVLALMVDDDSELRLARAKAELARATASLAEANALLAAAERNWEEPYELERALASARAHLDERRAELAQLPSLIDAERALFVKAQEELKSIEKAYRGDAAAEIEFIIAREQANAQGARLEALRAREPILQSAIERLESELHAAQRALDLRIDDRARLDTARAKVDLARAELALREAMQQEAQLELDRMSIVAPITGYVQSRLKAPGDKVIRMMDAPHSTHIAHLYDPSKLQVRVDVPLADASQVYAGQACEVVVEVLPDRVFKGEVLIVTHEADLQKNTLQVKVRVIDPDPVLRPEMLTRVKFLSTDDGAEAQSQRDSSDSAVTTSVRVPSQVIENLGDASRVWVIKDRANGRGVLQPIPVVLQGEHEGWVTVSGKIQPGALIAADPSVCSSGEQVRFETPKRGAS